MIKKILLRFHIKPYQALFSLCACVLIFLVGWFFVYATLFLVDNLNQALDVKVPSRTASLQFDIKGFEKLHLNVSR